MIFDFKQKIIIFFVIKIIKGTNRKRKKKKRKKGKSATNIVSKINMGRLMNNKANIEKLRALQENPYISSVL